MENETNSDAEHEKFIIKETPYKNAFIKALKLRRRYINHLIKVDKINMDSIKYHGWILTFFGCGKWKYGPGTLASLVTTFIWLMVSYLFYIKQIPVIFETVMWLSLSVAMFVYGLFIIPLYSKMLGVEDHSSIVLDEVMGQIVALAITYHFIKPYYFIIDETRINSLIIIFHISFCFLLFRLLDIAKPSFIGRIDRNIKGGIGVMLDDLVCGLITGFAGVVLFAFLNYFLKLSDSVLN